MKNILLATLFFTAIILWSCSTGNKKSETEQTSATNMSDQDSIDFVKANGKLTPEILWKFGRVSDIQLSPDKKTVLFGVKKYNLQQNKGWNYLYTMPAIGGEIIKVSPDSISVWNGVWTSDGKQIAWLAVDEEFGSQIYLADTDGKNIKRVSEIEGGITGFKFSPDGKKILFTKDVKLDNDIHDIYPDLPEANARIIEEMMYRHWNEWHDYAYSHIFVADFNGAISNSKDIMEGERFDCPMKPWGGMEQINWSKDGKKNA